MPSKPNTSGLCCLDPSTRVPVNREKLIAALKKAREAYAARHMKELKEHKTKMIKFRSDMIAWRKRVASALVAFSKKIASGEVPDENVLLGTNYNDRGRVATVLFETMAKMNCGGYPYKPQDPPTEKQLERAFDAFDTQIAQLEMSDKEVVSVSVEDFRRYMNKC